MQRSATATRQPIGLRVLAEQRARELGYGSLEALLDEAYAAGRPWSEVATQLAVCDSDSISKWARRLGMNRGDGWYMEREQRQQRSSAPVAGPSRQEALLLSSLADIYSDLDEYEPALQICDQALSLAQQVSYQFLVNYVMLVQSRLNRLLGSDFKPRDWRHVALFNTTASRIEMHLEARAATTARWPGAERQFAAGARIHTENSYKYTLPGLRALLQRAGFGDTTLWTDEEGGFAVAVAAMKPEWRPMSLMRPTPLG
jgi:hypothetical protein